jgi:hypothetical protein
VARTAAPAVELVSAARNRSGDEWNTGGVVYGELEDARQPCPDQRPWLDDPTRFSLGSTSLGTSADGWDEDSSVGWFGTFHPTVARLRVTDSDGRTSLVDTVALPEDPDGPRLAAFTTPPGGSRGTVVALLRADRSVVTVTEWQGRDEREEQLDDSARRPRWTSEAR